MVEGGGEAGGRKGDNVIGEERWGKAWYVEQVVAEGEVECGARW